MSGPARAGSVVAAVPIMALALVARLPGLWGRPLWYDEAFSAIFASRGLPAMLEATVGGAGEVHPLLYYLLLRWWQSWLGAGPADVRSLSLLFGLGVVALGYGMGRRIFGPQGGMLAGLALALSPFQVHYAQEARMYSLLAFLLLAATWALWEALHEGGWRFWVGFALLGAAAQYTHNLAALFLLPLGLTPLLMGRWRDFGRVSLAGGAALLLYAPWLAHVGAQWAMIRRSYWIGRPGLVELVRTFLVFVSGLPVPAWALPIVLFTALLAAVIALLAIWQGLRMGREGARRAGWLLYLAASPVVLMFLVSQLQPVYLDRAMLPAGAVFLMAMAWVYSDRLAPISRLMLWTGRLALGLAFLLGLIGFYSYRGFPYAPYQGLNSFLRAQVKPGEVILHSNKLSALPATYYGPDLTHRYLADPAGSGSDTLAPVTQEVLGFLADESVGEAVGGASAVWFIQFPREVEEYRRLGLGEHPAKAWLEANFTPVGSWVFDELRLTKYVR